MKVRMRVQLILIRILFRMLRVNVQDLLIMIKKPLILFWFILNLLLLLGFQLYISVIKLLLLQLLL
jgi:hypothetical protein